MVAAGGVTQAPPQSSIFERLIKRIGKRLGVPNRHEGPVAFMSNDLADTVELARRAMAARQRRAVLTNG
jgi:hypothetical protein